MSESTISLLFHPFINVLTALKSSKDMVRVKPKPHKNATPSVTESPRLKNRSLTRVRPKIVPCSVVLQRLSMEVESMAKYKEDIEISKVFSLCSRPASGKTKVSEAKERAEKRSHSRPDSIGSENSCVFNDGNSILKDGYIYEPREIRCRTPDDLPLRTQDIAIYDCYFCQETRCDRVSFIEHVQKHLCSKCPFSDNNWVVVARHVRSRHTEFQPFSCYECGYSSHHLRILRMHIKRHFKQNKTFSCEYCGYLTFHVNSLKIHTRSHFSRPFHCSDCNFASTTQAALRLHRRIHTTSFVTYSCSLCDYRGADRNLLKSHMRTHSGHRPFKCPLCDFRSRSKPALSNHMVTHTKARPFACGVCDYAAGRYSTLKIHMRLHTGEKPYICVSCAEAFHNLTSLTRHRERQHGTSK